jgi:arginase
MTPGTHPPNSEIAVVSVPTALGLSPNPKRPDRPRGTWRAPHALGAAGLLSKLDVHGVATVTVPPYRPERDPATGIRNREGLVVQTRELAERVGQVLDRGERALVLGGDCSVLIGAALALRRRGRFGLVFLDGHLDYRHLGNSERLSAAAGEDLAIVTGRGLDDHANIDSLRPYVRDRDVVALGEREHDPATADIRSTESFVLDLDEVQSLGVLAAARAALERMSAGPDGYWVHLDLDVLDNAVMPAVDSPQPGGLPPDQLVLLLRELLASDLACGVDVTIYDPELDPDGSCGALVTDVLAKALGTGL